MGGTTQSKHCKKCKVNKPFDDFAVYRIYKGKPARRGFCISCYNSTHREHYKLNPKRYYYYKIKHRFGLTAEQYDKLWKDQLGLCSICKTDLLTTKSVVDHDHQTNIVRGILCDACNLALGKFQDNIEVLKSAIHYLEREQDGNDTQTNIKE